MAKISTRPAQIDFDAYEALLKVIVDSSGGLVGKDPKVSKVIVSSTYEGLLDNLSEIFERINATGQLLISENIVLQHSNDILGIKFEEAMNMLDHIMDISYDQALDDATAELMDAFVTAGIGEVSQSGELQFDQRITAGRADLKPILREAISVWLGTKIA